MSFVKVSLLFLFLSSCSKGISFNPDFYIGDSGSAGIVNEDGIVVLAIDAHFNDFACMTKEKIKELDYILMTAKLPSKVKFKLAAEYSGLKNRFKIAP